jgi:hypothetical protein
LATAGPTITTPLAGDYVLRYSTVTDGGTGFSIHSAKIGAAATSDNDRLAQGAGGSSYLLGGQLIKTGIAASTAVKIQYRVSAGTLSAGNRRFQMTPIRVG